MGKNSGKDRGRRTSLELTRALAALWSKSRFPRVLVSAGGRTPEEAAARWEAQLSCRGVEHVRSCTSLHIHASRTMCALLGLRPPEAFCSASPQTRGRWPFDRRSHLLRAGVTRTQPGTDTLGAAPSRPLSLRSQAWSAASGPAEKTRRRARRHCLQKRSVTSFCSRLVYSFKLSTLQPVFCYFRLFGWTGMFGGYPAYDLG